MDSVTISIERFKELEMIEDASLNDKILYRQPFGTIRSIGKNEFVEALTINSERYSKEADYYRRKLENLPYWFKMLYPNSWH